MSHSMTDLDKVAPISSEMRSVILAELKVLAAREDVSVLFAIESGSRAWGFPSPDSDYDVRFVYARPAEWYVSIAPGRDVIERPIDGDLDINGWDIRKALGLLLKPNPVLLEWLSSPIRYLWDDTICSRLMAFAAKTAHGPACRYHYLHLGERQWKVYIDGKQRVNLKKYLYIVRPALALRWIRLNPDSIPPMNFQQLVAGADLASNIASDLEALLLQKSRASEVGEGPRLQSIDDLIEFEFDWARNNGVELRHERHPLRDEADALLRNIVSGVGT
jgi:predicted nucleotidyltransferase